MEEIVKTIVTASSMLVSAVTTLIALLQRAIKSGLKKTDTLYNVMLTSMEQAEQMYAPIKAKGIDVSQMKKEKVLNDLQIFASTNKIKFVKDEWDKEIERMIEFSNSINSSHLNKEII